MAIPPAVKMTMHMPERLWDNMPERLWDLKDLKIGAAACPAAPPPDSAGPGRPGQPAAFHMQFSTAAPFIPELSAESDVTAATDRGNGLCQSSAGVSG
jgi:hypothetical protein